MQIAVNGMNVKGNDCDTCVPWMGRTYWGIYFYYPIVAMAWICSQVLWLALLGLCIHRALTEATSHVDRKSLVETQRKIGSSMEVVSYAYQTVRNPATCKASTGGIIVIISLLEMSCEWSKIVEFSQCDIVWRELEENTKPSHPWLWVWKNKYAALFAHQCLGPNL